MSLPPHTHYVGYHASAAGGASNAVKNALAGGAKAFAFFTRSNRTWTCPALTDAEASKFKAACAAGGYSPDHILPHGTYLSNLGADPGSDVGVKSYDGVRDEMRRCAALGLRYYNWHPGSNGNTAAGIANVCAAINRLHAEVPGVHMVVETMAGQGSSLGSSLEEVRDIIEGVADKSRMGVCVDTAHIHGAGYDITTGAPGWDAFMARFDAVVGLPYLRGMHLNDSKVAVGARKDRHENIGHGFVGTEAFRAIMNDARVAGIPLILETPEGPDWLSMYTREVALLYSLVGTKAGDPVPPALVGGPAQAKAKAARGKKAAAAGGDGDAEEGEGEGDGEGEGAGDGGDAAAAAAVAAAVPPPKKGRGGKAAKATAAAGEGGAAAAGGDVAAAPVKKARGGGGKKAGAVAAAAEAAAAGGEQPPAPAAAKRKRAAAPAGEGGAPKRGKGSAAAASAAASTVEVVEL